jgi:hypothetical protein
MKMLKWNNNLYNFLCNGCLNWFKFKILLFKVGFNVEEECNVNNKILIIYIIVAGSILVVLAVLHVPVPSSALSLIFQCPELNSVD